MLGELRRFGNLRDVIEACCLTLLTDKFGSLVRYYYQAKKLGFYRSRILSAVRHIYILDDYHLLAHEGNVVKTLDHWFELIKARMATP